MDYPPELAIFREWRVTKIHAGFAAEFLRRESPF
jgi:hypothetical protein